MSLRSLSQQPSVCMSKANGWAVGSRHIAEQPLLLIILQLWPTHDNQPACIRDHPPLDLLAVPADPDREPVSNHSLVQRVTDVEG